MFFSGCFSSSTMVQSLQYKKYHWQLRNPLNRSYRNSCEIFNTFRKLQLEVNLSSTHFWDDLMIGKIFKKSPKQLGGRRCDAMLLLSSHSLYIYSIDVACKNFLFSLPSFMKFTRRQTTIVSCSQRLFRIDCY